ncbi:helix-turn-helix transcriptional regulator [Telmatospirillum sp. J64-1]|uniref:helix-turn-helix domain-containing protein n=1 Tax=Telmatospirillum sp. J64-1 TaxID=2502183 RepID=UPI00115C5366
MARTPKDWDREDIKAAIRKRGWTLERLSTHWGYCSNAVTVTLGRPWHRVELRISEFLGKEPKEIWPSRYHKDGRPRKGGHRTAVNRNTQKSQSNMQLSEAA